MTIKGRSVMGFSPRPIKARNIGHHYAISLSVLYSRWHARANRVHIIACASSIIMMWRVTYMYMYIARCQPVGLQSACRMCLRRAACSSVCYVDLCMYSPHEHDLESAPRAPQHANCDGDALCVVFSRLCGCGI